MSEPRVSIEDWIIKSQGFGGKKQVKIELYPAGFFRERFDIWDRTNWHPKPSLQGAARQRYWKDRYRVRVDGKWYSKKAKYQTFTMDEVYQKIVKKIARQP